MFKNIIFDWSGVVKDSVCSHVWVVSRMMEAMGGKEISLEEMKENWVQPYMKFWSKYYPELTLEQEQKLYYGVISRKDCPKSEAYPGVVELIKKLKKKGIPMVILSSDPPDTIFSDIKSFGLENVFQELFVNVHDKAEKVNELIEKNNFNRKETVFIGDSNHEVEVGKYAGIKTIAVTWGFSTKNNLELTKPDFLVSNVKELEKILFS